MRYPAGVKPTKNKNIVAYGNRGMNLENELNITNQYYRDIDKAYIYKKPTPIKILESSYANNVRSIKKAVFESPSTTDYNGLYNGMYIDYEAKETKNSSSFPLHNIHKHQIEHIRNIDKHNGICFLIVSFTSIGKIYLLFSKEFIEFLDNNNRKSIPIKYFEEKGYQIKDKYMPRIDYLEIIDKVYGGR